MDIPISLQLDLVNRDVARLHNKLQKTLREKFTEQVINVEMAASYTREEFRDNYIIAINTLEKKVLESGATDVLETYGAIETTPGDPLNPKITLVARVRAPKIEPVKPSDENLPIESTAL